MDALLSFMSFPLNLIFAAIWVIVVVWLWNDRRESSVVRFFLSPAATISSLLIFLAVSLFIGLSGMRWLTGTIFFAAVLFYLMTVLLFVIIRGWRKAGTGGVKKIRWRFTCMHAGLLLALSSAFWGTPDSRTMRLQLSEGIPTDQAYYINGRGCRLAYEIELEDFIMEMDGQGMPSSYEAHLLVDGEKACVRVNHPYSRSLAEDVYLTGFEYAESQSAVSCVVQVVREPWKYPAMAGIIMMLAGAFMLFLKGPKSKS